MLHIKICNIFEAQVNNIDMESKRSRFEKVAGNRVQHIIDKLDLLGNCSNKNNYEYSEEDVKKMFNVIREQVKLAESKFNEELSRKMKKEFKF